MDTIEGFEYLKPTYGLGLFDCAPMNKTCFWHIDMVMFGHIHCFNNVIPLRLMALTLHWKLRMHLIYEFKQKIMNRT